MKTKLLERDVIDFNIREAQKQQELKRQIVIF